jgi:DNA-binding response OmpR family regulator
MSTQPEIREVLLPAFSTGRELQAITAGFAPDEVVRVGLQEPNPAHLLNFPAYPLTVDLAAREVRSNDLSFMPTRTQFEILAKLALNPGTAFNKYELYEYLHGDLFGDVHVITVHNSVLRKKMTEALQVPYPIRTVRGVGFIFDPTPRMTT